VLLSRATFVGLKFGRDAIWVKRHASFCLKIPKMLRKNYSKKHKKADKPQKCNKIYKKYQPQHIGFLKNVKHKKLKKCYKVITKIAKKLDKFLFVVYN